VCEAPPNNLLLLLLLASCIAATHINSFFLFFFLGLKSIIYIALFSDFVGFFFCYVENKPSGGEIPLERKRKSSQVSCSTIPKHFKLLAYELFL
jgi:hypothetical protein